MAHTWDFVSNSLKFHLFHVISECSDSNMSKSKVIYIHEILSQMSKIPHFIL